MIRIKYSRVGDYLITKKTFSTRTYEELIYGAIKLSTLHCFIAVSSVPRDPSSLDAFVPAESYYGTSLVNVKKTLKVMLTNCGVQFDVEVRNAKNEAD